MREYKSIVLPDSIQSVTDAIGAAAAASFVRAYGGTRQYIPMPSGINEAHQLTRLLGLPLAMKLSRALGGTLVNVPACEWLEGNVRREEIIRRSKSETVTQIALTLGMSERSVYRIIKEYEQPVIEAKLHVTAHR